MASSARSLSPHHKRSFSTRQISPRSHRTVPSHLQHLQQQQQQYNQQLPATVSASALPPHARRQSHMSGNNNNNTSSGNMMNNQRRGSTTSGAMNLGLNTAAGSNHSVSPRHYQNKASYFFPELTQGCLFFRDFTPALLEKGGTFSSPQYEPFSKLIERANQWILSCDIPVQVIKAECITARAEHNSDNVDSQASFHPDFVDWGMFLLSLRIWCRQAASPSLEAGGLGNSNAGVENAALRQHNNDQSKTTPPTASTAAKTSPLVSTRCMSLDVENYQPLSKQMYLSPNTSSPRLSPMNGNSLAAPNDDANVVDNNNNNTGNGGGMATVVGSTANITAGIGERRSPRPASSTSSRASDPTTPPVFTGRLAYLDVLPDLLKAGVRTIEYERLSALVAKLNQKILDKKACNILTVQTVALRLHSNDTPDTECTCFSLHGAKQKCRLLFLRVFYFVPKLYGTPPSRTSPREGHNPSSHSGEPKSPTEPLSSSTTNSAASSRRSSLSRDAHQHQKLLSQLAENQHRHASGGLPGSSPSSRRGSGAYKEEIGLADFVPQIMRTNLYGKQGIEGMTSLVRRAGEWFKRYREEHTDIRLVNFQTLTYYVRDWKHVDTERHGCEPTRQSCIQGVD